MDPGVYKIKHSFEPKQTIDMFIINFLICFDWMIDIECITIVLEKLHQDLFS